MVNTPENLKIVEDRFIAPYRPYLELAGFDEMKQRFHGDTLAGLTFPLGYAANRSIDLVAPLHEFGHFITMDEARCAKDGFGFRGGIPYVSCGEFYRHHTGPWSATSEGRAVAWEIIALRDLFGVEPNYEKSCSPLSHTVDFLRYGGNGREGRIAWVADKVRNWVSEFGTIKDFERVWHERCSRLPEILALETMKLAAMARRPMAEETIEHHIDGELWTFNLNTYGEGGTEQFLVDITCSEAEGQSESEIFDRKDQALRWIDRTVGLAMESANTPAATAPVVAELGS
ncbi:hypothetical protein OIU34_21220 [Pararhizobium sp. BT-229]|uniref:hypothetical protein n=1 Tax=Pararhizobium sp. BT-229 TaxID=2986923 RepID=UPI0021F78147|nr:hypothetical protein [Pararhizobium sp. BT-229]MCV9964413.1 hypothetical protein [Pararhizobium sp. BT-229]